MEGKMVTMACIRSLRPWSSGDDGHWQVEMEKQIRSVIGYTLHHRLSSLPFFIQTEIYIPSWFIPSDDHFLNYIKVPEESMAKGWSENGHEKGESRDEEKAITLT